MFNLEEEPSIDHGKLLQTIHDDKATLSRALTQNKQLKDQLTELQDQFIKMVKDDLSFFVDLREKNDFYSSQMIT